MKSKIFGTDSVRTLDELERDALRTADVLRERGVNWQDRVLLKAENSTGYLTVLLALMHIGTSIVLVDQKELPGTTRKIIRQAGVKMSIVDDDGYGADDGTHQIRIYELQVAAAGRAAQRSQLTVRDWCEMPDSLIMWSSGSTGSPKASVKSGGRFLRNLDRNRIQVGHVADDVLVPLLPFSHQYGLSMVLIAWLARCSLVIAPYRRLDRALRMAEQCKGTVFDATPASYRSMLNMVSKRTELRTSLAEARMLCAGAAPLDSNLVDKYVEEFGLPLLDSYGSTELGNVAFATTDNPVACGRAMDGIEVVAVNEGGEHLSASEIGEILVRTPDVMEGYLDEDGNVQPLDPLDDHWYATGDFGYLDEQDNLHVLGRKLAVHRMGYTIYPEIIERKVGEVGCSAKVVPLADDRAGSRLIMFVEDEQNREASYWRERVAEVLPVYEAPNRVLVVDCFPLNRNGKPDRKKLEELALAE